MSRLHVSLLALAVLLAGCQAVPTAEEVRAFDLAACDAAGFEAGSDAHGLCLLLQSTNRRLDALERRLNFIELDVRTGFGWGRSCLDPRC